MTSCVAPISDPGCEAPLGDPLYRNSPCGSRNLSQHERSRPQLTISVPFFWKVPNTRFF